MSTVEIDEQELALLKQAFDLQESLITKNRKGYESLVKSVHKDAIKTTEDEIDPYISPLKETVEDLAKWKESISRSAKEHEEENKFSSLRKTYGLTDEGADAVKKMMKERGITDPEAAIALWERKNPPKSAAEEAYSANPLAFVDDDSDFVKKLHENPDRAAREMAMKTFRELRTNQ